MQTFSSSSQATDFQFYPTPPNVINQLVSPYYGLRARALEPSAGRGDIVARLTTAYGLEVSCCEISADLRAILISKGYKVIGTDFLTMEAPYPFGLVVMNPPFAKCAEHVVKAWDMLLPGGKLGAILPESAIGKTIGKFAELNQLIDLFGKVEPIGAAFASAERKTDVKCVIVRLEKPDEKTFKPFERWTPKVDPEYTEPQDPDLPAPRDMVRSIVSQYQAAMRALKVAHESEMRFRSLVPSSVLSWEETRASYIERIDRTKTAFWDLIFEKTKIGEVTTSNFRKQFAEERAKLAQIEFSEQMIYEVLHRFMQNKDAILDQCVLDVFKQATRYSMDNAVRSEQWHTNKSHKITPKIIMPYGLTVDWSWHIRYGDEDFFNDLDKILTMFGGTNGNCTLAAIRGILDQINQRKIEYMQKFESPNFSFRVYKKGTVHLYFKDLKALEMINRYAAERQMFVLPSGK